MIEQTASALQFARPRVGLLRKGMNLVRRKPLGAAGAVFVIALLAVAVVGPLFSKDPLEIDVFNRLKSPSGQALFGTDDKGRDVLARVIEGTGISLMVGLVAAGVGVTFASVFALLSAYLRGTVDAIGNLISNSFLAFPSILLAMALTLALGRSVWTVGIALAFVSWAPSARVIRAAALGTASSPYIEAARVVGASTPRILFRHLLPNLASIYIVLATTAIAQAILSEASLSYLGVGVPAPKPSLGSMVLSGQQFATNAPWMAIFPGVFITLAVFGFNLFGDALRDELDPRLRRR